MSLVMEIKTNARHFVCGVLSIVVVRRYRKLGVSPVLNQLASGVSL
jgi:hypothetical protein